MISQQFCRRPTLPSRSTTLAARPVRTVRMQLFRRDGPVLVEEGAVEELNQPTKRQREQIKRTLQELGFTEQAADILAYGKITNSNADLLIGDIRASFGIYQAPPPQGPVETVQNGVQDLLDRLRLPFLGLVLAAGLAAAFSQRRTTVSYDTTFQVHKELLSQILNTVLRVKERDSRQVGDPFIAPYLAGIYQRLGLEYSGLLCFTRVTLLWRRIAAATTAAAVAVAEGVTAPPGSETDAAEAEAAAASGRLFAARVVTLDWHVQQLHRELVLEPWKAADLRLMLSRAAAYAEGQASTGPLTIAAAAAGDAACRHPATWAAGGHGGGGGGLTGPWLPRHASALIGGGGGGGGGGRMGGYSPGGSGGCDGSSNFLRAWMRAPLGAVLFWLMWLWCPTMLVALEAMQAAPDNPWMALYICVIATCRTLAEWRATASVVLAPGLTLSQRVYGLAAVHVAVGLAAAVVTGLLNTWLPLLGHGAATVVVWLHLVVLPTVMVAVLSVAGMPQVARQLAGGGRAPAGAGGVDGGGARRTRRGSAAAAADVLGLMQGRRPGSGGIRDGDRGGLGSGGGGDGGGGGRGGGRVHSGGTSVAAAAAAAAQVHWPPALDVPAWLDDWPNAPEAFRCPITQSLMREPAQASSGVTYERPAIVQWLDHRRVDPVTHVPLKRHRLAPNLNLRHMIEVWVQDRVEARRRLAQRLREELSTEAAAKAAAAAAAAVGTTTATPRCSAAAEAVASAAEALAAAAAASFGRSQPRSETIGATAAGAGSGAGGEHSGDAAVACTAVSGAAAAAGGAGAVASRVESPETAEVADSRPEGSVRTTSVGVIARVGDVPGGGANGGAGGLGAGASSGVVQVEEVEALALAAARERAGRSRRRCPGGFGAVGCDNGRDGSGGGTTHVCSRHRRSGSGIANGNDGGSWSWSADGADGVAEEVYGNDGLDGEDAGAMSTGSGESPFAAPLTLAAGGSGADAEEENELAADPQASVSAGIHVGGGGSDVNSYVYDNGFGSDRGDHVAGAEQRNPAAASTAADTDLRRQEASLGHGPSFGLVWDGADPDSSGVYGVDGSGVSTTAAAATAVT
ncbi:hypothetical protein VOLCADRAFT_102616 [Volvox carteri f. nagariensis]|uniref:U-box domain-containing protein n=1 Tax=Volvox carteri f. nagariensis TaxID=3068 RepID=D8TH31_VOLCA|nr:uncharacterized protein VOLCADRAFT_102616 [Volvox carteri f. nagariensis]EFJ52638.1 hypothetical protein VOLCADRAFT_102616 [Volvox carteri f. nagariensis]|eukprot:XP_002945643.1 hypothetical protein VOLCADRAFT_102616 [Volvox carteri f. nagariensis]